jgi:hypothetical protein
MAEKKVTKTQRFEEIKAVLGENATFADGELVADFLDHEIELLANRNNKKSNKETKRALANKALLEEIIEVLDVEVPMTATEIAEAIKTDKDGEPVSFNRVSAVIRTLGGDRIEKNYDKKTAVFTLA